MEDCLKMLRGETDSQRLAGLLLVTKVFKNDDHSAILQVYQAIGSQFLLRLLRTGTPTHPHLPSNLFNFFQNQLLWFYFGYLYALSHNIIIIIIIIRHG